MRSGKELFCIVALISTVDVLVSARDVVGVQSRWRSRDILAFSGSRKLLQSDVLDGGLLGAIDIWDAKCVQRFLDAGASPNSIHEDGRLTPIFLASANGFIDGVRILLNAGADVNLANKNGHTALHTAAENGYPEIIDFLLASGADHSIEDKWGWTPLSFASRYGNAESLRNLIYAGGNILHQVEDGWAPIHLAARYGHLAVVKLLVEKGADMEVETFEYKSTPMNLAAIDGSGIIIQTLIDAGADINHKDSVSYTPLMQAAYWGNLEAVEVLVYSGADKSVVRPDGLNAQESVCLCTTESKARPLCKVRTCKKPRRMKRILDP